jgi:hypothetical protein
VLATRDIYAAMIAAEYLQILLLLQHCLPAGRRPSTPRKTRRVERKTGMKTKDELLRHYAARTPKRFVQVDGFYWPGGDMFADKDGFAIFGSETWELMVGADVRILIDPEADPSTVYGLIKRAADNVRTGLMGFVSQPELPFVSDQQGVAELFETEQEKEMTTEERLNALEAEVPELKRRDVRRKSDRGPLET